MKKSVILIMAITIISKILGFGRDITLSYFYGASNISDAYIISQTVPALALSLVGVAIATSFIPAYHSIEGKNIENTRYKFLNNLFGVLLAFGSIATLIVFIFSKEITFLFAYGFDTETINLASTFSKITSLVIIPALIINLFNGLLHANKKFLGPALVGIPLNIILILSFFLASTYNKYILAVGYLLAVSSQFFAQATSLKKLEVRIKPSFNFKDKYVKLLFKMAVPTIIGTSIAHVNGIVDKSIASSISKGGISVLNYANRLNLFVFGIFISAIVTVIYPSISEYASKKEIDSLKATLKNAILMISILVIPSIIGLIALNKSIVEVVFGRGKFDAEAISLTASALTFYSIGLLGLGLREVITRVFYAFKDTKSPMINASVGVGLNIVLNIVLSKFMGLDGLALATSISILFTALLLMISLRKKIGAFGIKKLIFDLTKISFAGIIMGICAYFTNSFLVDKLSSTISLGISIVLAGVVYLVIVLMLRIEIVDVLVKGFKEKFAKKV